MCFSQSILQRQTHVSCREYVGIPQSARFYVNQGGTTDSLFVLDSSAVGDFLFFQKGDIYALNKTMAAFSLNNKPLHYK